MVGYKTEKSYSNHHIQIDGKKAGTVSSLKSLGISQTASLILTYLWLAFASKQLNETKKIARFLTKKENFYKIFYLLKFS